MSEERTIGKERVAVSVVQALSRGQALDGTVAVAVVLCALDLRQMGGLVKGGGSLVLGVALGAEAGQGAEVQRARDHEAAGGYSVGEDVAGAVAECVGAVLGAYARGGATALVRDLVEDISDGVAGGRRRRLEVLGELGCGAAGGGSGGRLSQFGAVAQGSSLRGAAGSCAVGLDRCSLDVVVEVTADLGRGNTVDVRFQNVAVEGHGAIDAGAVRRGRQERSTDEEVKVTAGAEIVNLGRVKLGLDTLSGGEGLESILGHVGCLHLETNTIKSNLVGCTSRISLSERLKIVKNRGNPSQSPLSKPILAAFC